MFRFDGFELEPAARELRNEAGAVHIEPQVFDVLLHLAENRDRVVSKNELLDAVWGHRFVTESALTSRIRSARRAVGDSGERQAVIKTSHGAGYRFVAQVEVVDSQQPAVATGRGGTRTSSTAPRVSTSGFGSSKSTAACRWRWPKPAMAHTS